MELTRKPELPQTIKTRIILIFTILVILPFIILSILAFSMFSRYAVRSILDATKDTVSMVSYQIHSSTKEYEELTMSLYYDNTVELLHKNNTITVQDQEKIKNALQSCCSRSGVRSAYLITDDNAVLYGGEYYPEIVSFANAHRNEIDAEKGVCVWFPTNELHGNAQETSYILARTLNSKSEKNVGVLCLIIDENNIFSESR